MLVANALYLCLEDDLKIETCVFDFQDMSEDSKKTKHH